MTEVQVQEGIVNGKVCVTYYGKKYYSFEGVPYAKPPLGKLRFRNPEEPDSWSGVRDATQPGNKCAQLNPYSNTGIDGSEDCLYLNIYTPSLPREKLEKLPVIFFIHGGRMIFGHGHYYTPDYLIRHEVILVTINYRLNALGFLCLNIPEAPGNIGVKDAAMALKWVNRNIACFNGDPGNVTVCGESAGGAIATSFITSKMTRGLFSKMIGQSGNSLSDLYLIDEDPILKAKKLALILNKDLEEEKALYEFLVNVPIEDLIYAFSTLELDRPPSIINAYFLPVIEKEFEGVDRFFDEHPLVAIRGGRYEKVPLLTGVNTHEAALFLQRDDKGNIIYEKNFNYFIPRFINLDIKSAKAKEFCDKLKNFYFKSKPVGDSTKEEYIKMTSDLFFLRDALFFVEIFSGCGNDVYFYKFKYSGNMNTRVMKSLGIKGTCHGDMIQYQFYRKAKADKCTDGDLRIVDFLSEAWCNFAKNGKPTWTNQKTEWLPYTQNGRYSLVIDEEIELAKDLDGDRLKFWIGITKERCKL